MNLNENSEFRLNSSFDLNFELNSWNSLEFCELESFGTLRIGNYGILWTGNFWNFTNWKFSEFSKVDIFGISKL